MPESPSLDDLRRLAASQRLHLSDAQLAEFGVLIDETLGDSYARLDELAAPAPGAPGPRDPGVRPGADEDPLGAWYRRCEIREREDGPLAGLRVAVKDNINVAGVPMMNGSRMVEGYTPAFDATVITRILAAGGTIAGKAVCEHLCFSGGSHTSDTGPVRNPHDPARNAGGSSSGSAALVASGAVELALGGDQGGSIRVPASYCGCYGLKPTFGLVPYTGAAPIERTLDHLGPMAASPHGLALLLSVIAGPDGLDPRQGGVEPGDYLGGLGGGVGGLRIGIVREGFGWEQSEAPVDEAVRTTIARLAEGGAVVEELSIPRHRDGLHVWTGIAVEGAFNTVVRGNSGGTNAAGVFDTALIDHITAAREADPDAFSATVKFTALLGEWLQTRYGGRYYAHARNLARDLRGAYDDALERHDVLVMPTTPRQATLLPAPDAAPAEILERAWECEVNTRPFDVTGHPALSLPCAMHDGLPVGAMLVARHGAEATLLRVAQACADLFGPAVGVERR